MGRMRYVGRAATVGSRPRGWFALCAAAFCATAVAAAEGTKRSYIYLPGDFVLGGLFPVHEKRDSQPACGRVNTDRGVQRLEAMRYAVQKVNADPTILRGVRLGLKIFDTCSEETHALDQSLDFVMNSLRDSHFKGVSVEKCAGSADVGEDVAQRTETDGGQYYSLMGVIGASYSSVSIQVANLLRLFKITQVSYASTSKELTDSNRYAYFLRTVPPDTLQAKALVDIVDHFNWTYVSTVASEGEYGDSGIASFMKEAEKKRTKICIAIQERIPKGADGPAFESLVVRLHKKRKARVVVLFVRGDDAKQLLTAARKMGVGSYFVWVASDGWGKQTEPVQGNEVEAQGSLTIELESAQLPDFDDYFTSLTPENNKANVWFDEFWEAVFRCRPQSNASDGPPTRPPSATEDSRAQPGANGLGLDSLNATTATPAAPYELEKRLARGNARARPARECSGAERLDATGYKQESKIQFVYDAVFAMAKAADVIYRNVCGQASARLCPQLTSDLLRQRLLGELLGRNFTDHYGHSIAFDENGDSLGYYNVMNFRYDKDKGTYEYSVVGKWEDNVLTIDDSAIAWPPSSGKSADGAATSVCSLPCAPGERKEMEQDGDSCCWVCIKCDPWEYVKDERTCADCGPGRWPNEDRRSCSELPTRYMRWESPYAIVPCSLAVLGLIITGATICLFVRNNRCAVVKASGRELSYMLLGGCALSYCVTFVILARPTTATCLAQRFGLGMSFAVMYSALLTKTNRIYRIFTHAKRSTTRPLCISPRSQLAVASALASVQFVVCAAWTISEPPSVTTYMPTDDRQTVVEQCNVETYSILFNLSYNIVLILVCTFYAVKARRIPSTFSESKFIGLAMYTTCVVWISFVPIYFGLSGSFEIQITTLSTAVTINATVALVCIFGPKVYSLLFRRRSAEKGGARWRYSSLSKANKVESDSKVFKAAMARRVVPPSETSETTLSKGEHAVNANISSIVEEEMDFVLATLPDRDVNAAAEGDTQDSGLSVVERLETETTKRERATSYSAESSERHASGAGALATTAAAAGGTPATKSVAAGSPSVERMRSPSPALAKFRPEHSDGRSPYFLKAHTDRLHNGVGTNLFLVNLPETYL